MGQPEVCSSVSIPEDGVVCPPGATQSESCLLTSFSAFELWCMRLGMTVEAVSGWRKLCHQPVLMSLSCFSSMMLYQAGYAVVLIGRRVKPAVVICPHAILAAAGVCFTARLWRMGPDAAKSPASSILILLITLSITFIFCSVSVGPKSWVPFQNVPLTTLIMTASVLFTITSSICGAVPTLHPKTPYASLARPLGTVVLHTIRSMDCFTDLQMIRLIRQQVCTSACVVRILLLSPSAHFRLPSCIHCDELSSYLSCCTSSLCAASVAPQSQHQLRHAATMILATQLSQSMPPPLDPCRHRAAAYGLAYLGNAPALLPLVRAWRQSLPSNLSRCLRGSS